MNRSKPLKRDTVKAREFASRGSELKRKPVAVGSARASAGARNGEPGGSKRRTRLKPGKGFAASPAQRAKVKDQHCVVCGKDRFEATIDPAHIVSRGMGGCDHEDCVVALCRGCHNAYDHDKVSLLEFLEPRYRLEVEHAVGHLGLIGALQWITHEKWRPE